MPSIASPQYDTAGHCLELARSITNDAAQSLQGNILASTQPYTFPMLNSCYRSLQEDLSNAGFEKFADEYTILTILPAFTIDPFVQVYVTYTGCNDGQNSFATPFLPDNLIGPIRLWERQTGIICDGSEMIRCDDGLPSRPQQVKLGQWEWRNDCLFFVGATQQNDVRMRFKQGFPPLTDDDSVVQIIWGDRALSYLLGREYGAQRGSQLYTYMDAQYTKAFQRLTTATARRKQRGSHRRQGYGSPQGWGGGIFSNF